MGFFLPKNGGLGQVSVPGIGGLRALGGIGFAPGGGPPPLSAYAAAVLSDSPIAFLRKSDTSGTAAVDEIGSHGGTYVNTPVLGVWGLITEGINERAVLYDDTISDQHVTVADDPALSFTNDTTDSEFSFEAWINVLDLSSHRAIVAKTGNSGGAGNEYLFQVRTDGTLECALYDDVTTDNHQWKTVAGAISVGVTYHVVATYNGTVNSGKIYIDKVDSTFAYTDAGAYSSMKNTASGVTLGARFPGFGGETYFNGILDEIAVYDTELSSVQIAAHYDAGVVAVPFLATAWDPTNKDSTLVLSEGNLRAVQGNGTQGGVMVVNSYSSNKYYCEITNLNPAAASSNEIILGIAKADIDVTSGIRLADSNTYTSDSGDLYIGTILDQNLSSTWSQNDVISILFQADANYVQFWFNGVVYGTILTYTWDDPTSVWITAGPGGSPLHMDIKANFGATPFVYDVPPGWTPGLPV